MPPDLDALHPLLAEAAQGRLPPWAEAGKGRREHMARVADLLGTWARERGQDSLEAARWTATGLLHDVLRDADPEGLRDEVDPPFRDFPGKVLHGPAAAARLKAAGVRDDELLHAIAYHTLGSRGFGSLGMALYAADFLEPGRKRMERWRKDLRDRAARELEAVVKEILLAKIRYQMERGRPVHPDTVAFWNRFSEGKDWASASEL